MYTESENLELKETFSDTIIRDIVSFLNSGGGDVLIGVDDNGNVVGLQRRSLDEIQKKISDIITSQIEPTPSNEISISMFVDEGKTILKISVKRGLKPLYCIKKYGFSSKGCLVRIGTTCKEMMTAEIEYRYKMNFVDDDYILKAPSHYAPLSFDMLKILLVSKGYHINETAFASNFSLQRDDGTYNLMAEILADRNMVPIIFVKFKGNTKASISQRSDYGDQSIILGLQRLKDRLIAENICITDTTVRPRVDEYLYDIDAVNEALVNAFVHNDWTISEPLVSFYSDRLEITSHGGIPKEITIDDFFNGVSHPRNTVLMRIFLKLGIVEHTGHGIPRIIKKYGKGVFDVHDTYVNVIIPFNDKVMSQIGFGKNNGKNPNEDGKNPNEDGKNPNEDGKNPNEDGKNPNEDGKNPSDVELTDNEKRVLLELINNPNIAYDALVVGLNISRRTVSRVFSSLERKGFIERVGTNKKGYWKIIR